MVDTFKNMIGIINTAIFNLFTGTTDEPVLGELTMTEEILLVEKRPKTKVNDLAEVNKYKQVPKLPQVTELMEVVLEPLCFDQLLTDKNFVDNELSKYAV